MESESCNGKKMFSHENSLTHLPVAVNNLLYFYVFQPSREWLHTILLKGEDHTLSSLSPLFSDNEDQTFWNTLYFITFLSFSPNEHRLNKY